MEKTKFINENEKRSYERPSMRVVELQGGVVLQSMSAQTTSMTIQQYGVETW